MTTTIRSVQEETPQLVVLNKSDLDLFIATTNKLIEKSETLEKIAAKRRPMTLKDVARYFSMSSETIRVWIVSGDLPTSLRHYIGRTPFWYEDELEAFLKSKS